EEGMWMSAASDIAPERVVMSFGSVARTEALGLAAPDLNKRFRRTRRLHTYPCARAPARTVENARDCPGSSQGCDVASPYITCKRSEGCTRRRFVGHHTEQDQEAKRHCSQRGDPRKPGKTPRASGHVHLDTPRATRPPTSTLRRRQRLGCLVLACRFFGAFTGTFDRCHAGIVAPGPEITNTHAPTVFARA